MIKIDKGVLIDSEDKSNDSIQSLSLESIAPFMIVIEAYIRAIRNTKPKALTKENKQVMKSAKPLMIRVMELQKKPFDPIWRYEYHSILVDLEKLIAIIIPQWNFPMNDLKGGV